MSITEQLEAAGRAGVIDQKSLEALKRYFAENPPAEAKKFDLAHLLWYVGALLIIGSMGLFSTIAFSAMGGAALVATGVIYALCFLAAGEALWRRGLTTPGGLLVTCAVGMAPLLTFGIQELTRAWEGGVAPGTLQGFYVWVKGGWVPMEVATLAAALLALTRYRFTFVTFIAAVALWFMSMDLAEYLGQRMGHAVADTWEFRRQVSQWFGLLIIVLAWLADLPKRSFDLGFWLHIAGITAFWGAITSSSSSTEVAKFVYFLFNIGLLLLAVFLGRVIYAVYGSIGMISYIGYLTVKIFADSIMFPFALTAIGVGVIALGLLLFRYKDKIRRSLEASIPQALQALRPHRARAVA